MSQRIQFPIVTVFLLGWILAPIRAGAQPAVEKLWRTGLNLVPDGTFTKPGSWRILDPRKNEDAVPSLADDLPTSGETVVYRQPLGNGRSENVLTMNLNYRQARRDSAICESGEIRVVPNMVYRMELRCRSSGPQPLILVRGYATVRDDKGQPALREVRQWRFVSVNPGENQWNTIRQEFTTDDSTFPIRILKIQLGGQARGGYLFFDNLVLKAIGPPPAPPPPATAPASRPATAPATQPGR
jgi:hypothetical protein